MKSFKINLEDRLQIGLINSRSLGRGRLKKGAARKRIADLGLRELGGKFYLEVANLKAKEIPAFIRDYQVTLPWVRKGSNFAVPSDITAFQGELREIIDGMNAFKKFRRSTKAAFTQTYIYKKAKNFPQLVNKYLSDCYLKLDLPPLISRPLTEEEKKSYAKEIRNSPPHWSGLLVDNVLVKAGPGTNFSNLTCHCNSLLSWCVLDLIVDSLVREEKIAVCGHCGRPFDVRHQSKKYCADKTCQAERARKRKQKNRQKN